MSTDNTHLPNAAPQEAGAAPCTSAQTYTPTFPLKSAMKRRDSSHSRPTTPVSSSGLVSPAISTTSPSTDFASGSRFSNVIGSPTSSPTTLTGTTPNTATSVNSTTVGSRPSTAQTASSSSSFGHPYSPSHSRSPGPPLHSAFNHRHAHSNSTAGAGYTKKVGFDTFENDAASMFSYTLHVQSSGYTRTRATRVFLCAASPDESGSQALDWALDALVRDGDELVVLRGVEKEDLEKDHEVVREEARELMKQIQEKGIEYDPDRKLSIIVEFIAGKITQTLDRLIALYRPDSLVVGTRGQRTMMQALSISMGGLGVKGGIGSVSKYCLSRSPVPVIVVRPERKVRKAMAKRRKDPKRGRHFEEEITRTKTKNITSVPLTPTPTIGG